jgi:hypothetical protein
MTERGQREDAYLLGEVRGVSPMLSANRLRLLNEIRKIDGIGGTSGHVMSALPGSALSVMGVSPAGHTGPAGDK